MRIEYVHLCSIGATSGYDSFSHGLTKDSEISKVNI